MAPKKTRPPRKQAVKAAKQEEAFEGKNIGRTNSPFRGSEQRGPGMNKGRGSTGRSVDD